MMPHNNIGFNSNGSEDMATEITKNRWFWPPHCRLGPFTTEPPLTSAWALYWLKVEYVDYTFATGGIWVYLLSNFRGEL